MWQRIKNFLKRFFPVPARTFNQRMDRLTAEMESLQRNFVLICQKVGQLDEWADSVRRQLRGDSSLVLDHVKQLAEVLIQQEEITQKRFDTIGLKQDAQQAQVNALDMRLELMQNTVSQTITKLQTLDDLARQSQEQQQESKASLLDGQVSLLDGQELIRQILQQSSKETRERLDKERNLLQQTNRAVNEALWSAIFNNTISEDSWLKHKAFSPGRWAAGYPFLYALYRVLREFQPFHILEVGLGQTTQMIAQYTQANDQVEHAVVEHDSTWVAFFENNFSLPSNSEIVQLDWDYENFQEVEGIRVYKGFREKFQGQRFDLLTIDGPLGGDMGEYSRIDILKLIPDCLADSFVILFDDCNRQGETNTVKYLIEQLKESGVDHCVGYYRGNRDTTLICSPDVKFLSSL